MSPFDNTDLTERRLRFDVLALAYQMFKDEIIDPKDKTVVEMAEGLMKFVDAQAVGV